MLLRVRDVLRNEELTLKDLSKLTAVAELRRQIAESFEFDAKYLRLICRGKILDDGLTLFDYQIEDGLTIFAQDRQKLNVEVDCSSSSTGQLSSPFPGSTASVVDDHCANNDPLENISSAYFSAGDKIDICDFTTGAWCEATIDKICRTSSNQIESANDQSAVDNLDYVCRYDRYPEDTDSVLLAQMRPRPVEKLNVEELVQRFNCEEITAIQFLVNFNVSSPGELGDWYATKSLNVVRKTADSYRVVASLYIYDANRERILLKDCKITKLDEFYVMRDRTMKNRLKENAVEELLLPLRTALDCCWCYDNPKRQPFCRYCRCVMCRLADNDDRLLLCEECHEASHSYCLTPPLTEIPPGDWYCPSCKNDEEEVVKSGQKSKLLTKRKAKMPSANSNRRWGAKQSCDGVSKKCTIVPKNHYGPIPGVEVGTCWRYRKQASEAGVHRPLVSGIHGRSDEGAFSIVLAGGYEDDVDDGDRIFYTGSGGRDLGGNRRVAEHTKPQSLDRFNAALARNCYSPTKAKYQLKMDGHNAGDAWKKGKPVRVIRSYKLKNSYAPKQGIRYDGIYKVVRYWPENGKTGHMVWRYELQRDDPIPAPWTENGKRLITEKGLDQMIDIEGESNNVVNQDAADDLRKPVAKKQKLSPSKSPKSTSGAEASTVSKKPRIIAYRLPADHIEIIKKDVENAALWDDCVETAKNGAGAFYQKLTEVFICAICQFVLDSPVTLSCKHLLCRTCVSKALKAGMTDCPWCRTRVDGRQPLAVNQNLAEALLTLMPGYNVGRGGKNRRKS